MTDIKEVKVTKAFLSLDERTKRCQNKQTYKECQHKEYLRQGREKCNCTPYELRDFSKMVKILQIVQCDDSIDSNIAHHYYANIKKKNIITDRYSARYMAQLCACCVVHVALCMLRCACYVKRLCQLVKR